MCLFLLSSSLSQRSVARNKLRSNHSSATSFSSVSTATNCNRSSLLSLTLLSNCMICGSWTNLANSANCRIIVPLKSKCWHVLGNPIWNSRSALSRTRHAHRCRDRSAISARGAPVDHRYLTLSSDSELFRVVIIERRTHPWLLFELKISNLGLFQKCLNFN